MSTPPPPRSVVVAGAGLAGARTVAALRDLGFAGRITVLGAEGLEPYDRPPLSKELLARTVPAWLRDEVGADVALADDVRLASPATGLEVPDEGPVTVRCGDGDVTADAVVVATGASPRRPPGWEGARTLHTAADAAALRDLLVPGARLVVVGAGWVGAEVAGVAAAAGVHVTVLEAAASPLAAALGEVGRLTEPWYAAAGVRLLTGQVVRSVHPDDGVAVTTDDGVLHADVALAAVGVRPTTGWVADAVPVAGDGFVDVDAGCVVPGTGGRVLAVGDVARRRSARHGSVVGGHWDAALREPELAAASLLARHGTDGPDDPAPYVFSTQLGHDLGMYGAPSPGDDVVLRSSGGPFTAVWFVPGSDQVTCVLAVDSPRDVAAARRLFSGPALPRLDRRAVAAGAPLR